MEHEQKNQTLAPDTLVRDECCGRAAGGKRGIAQSGSALRSGRRSRRFKSCCPDHAQDTAQDNLAYDPETGALTRFGVPTGTPAKDGYLRVRFGGSLRQAHRVCWYLHYGVWPCGELDHINGDKTDNRIGNLREATRRENNLNVGLRADNSSGFKGVSWDRRRQRWRAAARVPGGRVQLGYFATAEDAARAYDAHVAAHTPAHAWRNFK